MGAEPGRAGWVVPGAALTTLLFVQALRVWFPSVLFVVGDAGSTSALTMGAFALGCLLVGPLVAVRLTGRATLAWQLGALLLALGHAAFLFTDGGAPQAVTSSIAVIGGTLALASAAGLPGPGALTRGGIVLGLAAEVSIHGVLGSHTLAWRSGVPATLVSLMLAIALVVAVRTAARELERRTPVTAAGRAWPWLVLAPLLVLVLVLAGVPGRVAVATGWSPALVAITVVGGQALAALAVVLAPRLAPVPAGAIGGGLTLVGATGALEASGVSSAAAQLALAAGLAVIAVTEAPTIAGASARKRIIAASAGVFGFGVFTFVYYAAYDLRLGFYNRAVLLVAALAAAGLAALAARWPTTSPLRPALDRRRLLRLGTALAAVVALSGLVRIGDAPPPPAPGAPGEPIRLLLYNLHMGFDPQGRFAVPELARVIQEHDPDVVILNEVDRGWLTTGGHDVLQLLVDELDQELHHVFAGAADEVWGNAMLTRYPVTELSTGRLPRGNDPMSRGQLAAVVEVAPGVELGVVGTHLSHLDDQGVTRLPQARAVAATVAWLRERGLPTTVLGDLNAEPDSSELETFGSFVGPTLHGGNPTWPSWEPQVQIDHILISGDLRVLDAQVIDSQASDHLPLLVSVTVDEPEA